MFRQSVRWCTRARHLGVASFSSSSLTSRPAFRTLEQKHQAPLRLYQALNGAAHYRFSSASAAAVAADPVAPAEEPQEKMRFDELHNLGVHENLIRAITQGMKYETLSPVQALTIKPALSGLDLVAQAKTGTGKTLAFLIPLLQRMIQDDPSLASRSARRAASADDIRGIIISPTRELAEQIAEEAQKLVATTGLVVQKAVGGTRKREMLEQTRRQGCHLLVGTPGRINDLLQDPYSGIAAPNLAAIVLDEADRMLDVGFEKELLDIVSCLPDVAEKERQTLLFSATIPPNVVDLARKWMRPNQFDFIQTIAEDDVLTHDKVAQHIVPLRSWGNVLPTLYELVDKELAERQNDPDALPFKAIVFFPSVAWVQLGDELQRYLRQDGKRTLPTFRIHSKLTQQQRTRSAEQFRNCRTGILLSSDVTARGLDFPNVTHVIQVGAPQSKEHYIHRLGRTGRQEKEGQGWLLTPKYLLPTARSMLRDLPIKRNETFASRDYDFGAPDAEKPAHIASVTEATAKVSRSALAGAYLSTFGQCTKSDLESLLVDMSDWFRGGLGWPSAPAIKPALARKLGVGPRMAGANIGHEEYDDEGGRDGRGFGDRSRGFSDRSRGFSNFDKAFGGRGRDFGGRGDRDRGLSGFDRLSRTSRQERAPRSRFVERASF